METVADFIFLGSKIIVDGDCIYKIKRCLLLGRKQWQPYKPVQLLSRVQLFATPWTAAHQDSLLTTNPQSLLKHMSIESVMPSNHLILCRPLLLLPSIFPSIRVFSKESVFHIRWLKYWSFSFSISPFNEYSGLISFRIDWFDLLAVQGTLKNLLQHHSSKASILWCSALFMVQLSHPYMLSRLVIAFLPRSKHLLISWLQSPSAVDKPRQHIKKQRHHFANEDLYGWIYGFSRSHVQMWELDHKEGWALKNWCFETVVLKKTLESPLDSKEIKILMLGKIEGRRRGWQRMRWLDGITDSIDMEFEQAPGDGKGQRSLICCSPRGHKKLDMT